MVYATADKIAQRYRARTVGHGRQYSVRATHAVLIDDLAYTIYAIVVKY